MSCRWQAARETLAPSAARPRRRSDIVGSDRTPFSGEDGSSADDHSIDTAQVLDVLDGISLEQHEVRDLANLDRSQRLRQAQEFRR